MSLVGESQLLGTQKATVPRAYIVNCVVRLV